MSRLFIKKDYFKQLEILVNKGKFEAALAFAIKEGDALYDKGELKNASALYEKLLALLKSIGLSDHTIFERLYEKLVPLLFEEKRTEDAITYSLELVDTKVLLNKTEEAHEILDALKEKYRNSEKVFLKDVDFNLRKGDAKSALKTLDYIISNISPKPKFLELAIEILLRLNEKEKALDYVNTLIALDSQNSFAKAKLMELKKENEYKKNVVENKYSEKNFNEQIKSSDNVVQTPKKEEDFEEEIAVKENKESTKEKDKNDEIRLKEETSSNLSGMEKVDESSATKSTPLLFKKLVDSETYKKAISKILTSPDGALRDLMNLAIGYENEGHFTEAEYLYLKALLINSGNRGLIDRISKIYQDTNRVEDEIFLFKIATNSLSGNEKLDYLLKISELVPGNEFINLEIVRVACAIGNKELALKYFYSIKDNIDVQSFDELLDLMFSVVKKDVEALQNLSTVIRRKAIKTDTAFRYFQAVGKLLFNMGDRPEGLKWLMRASEVKKLPFEDYVMIAEYIKDIPLDTEKDSVAAALIGYIDMVSEDKKEYIFKLVLSLKPNNTLYIRKYAEFLNNKGRYKEMSQLIKELVRKSDTNSINLLAEAMPNVAEYLDEATLLGIINLFMFTGDTVKASEVYDILHSRDPKNQKYIVGKLILQIENEDFENVVKFFRENKPSHNYAKVADLEITKFEKKRASDPFNYHVHFVLGFLYYLTERYEEAIASFQFVLRSHRFEALMSLFLGMSFEKIGLSDFALKRYRSVLSINVESTSIKLMLYERAISLLVKQGKLEESRELGEKAIESGLQSDTLKKLIESIPKGDKIYHIGEMSNDK